MLGAFDHLARPGRCHVPLCVNMSLILCALGFADPGGAAPPHMQTGPSPATPSQTFTPRATVHLIQAPQGQAPGHSGHCLSPRAYWNSSHQPTLTLHTLPLPLLPVGATVKALAPPPFLLPPDSSCLLCGVLLSHPSSWCDMSLPSGNKLSFQWQWYHDMLTIL